ncbi:cell wall-binding protein [Desulfosporosinus sp. HMP52]|uniref:cell wall-binding repeat-containing protein n=1 Tax=Desulfosporosinus sp. HMP52 TaxID=1487923 RepID=UPI00051FBED2|nr:cell wall-binding repeat-containing protein [Desulfosporosinus sp. HMP52]KGK91247.1 cell wall-binding protein [Desulfosporosinus sp. HMP52]
MRKTKQKVLNSCMAVAVALSATIAPAIANAAMPSAMTRIGGYDQYATAALMAQKGWTGTSDSVVLSAGMSYSLVDALAAGPLAAKLKAPILLTDNGQTLNPSAKAELLRLKPKKVYITSGTAVIKQSVLNEISALGITPVQLGGYDQYETSVNIAKEMAKQGVNVSKVVVAAGWLTPADALSVAPIAAAQEMPILTTTQGQLPASVKTYLDSLNVKESYVVGGTAVVSDTVKGQLKGNVKRYSGISKYDTNVQILKGFTKSYKNNKVYVANGETLVDALAVVPLAASTGSPVVLVNQQPDNATKEFVKLNLSTDDMVAVGGEAVVPTTGMNALTSAVSYSTDKEAVGSKDAAAPVELTDNVRLIGDNITLQNAKANYSVYVKGDNITLKNLTVKGTVFVDPGDKGTATIDGVTAANIVVLSGASDSIHIKNTTAGVLTVDSDSDVRVEASGTTNIGDTVVRSFAILDANGAKMGVVTITSTPGQDPVVELRGTFTEPVVVESQVTLKAAKDAVVPSVVVNTETTEQKVTLEGSFKAVEVQSQGKLALAEKTVVESMKTEVKTEITIPKGSSIGNLNSGSTGTVVSGGGQVNGKDTTNTPSAPPGTPSTGGNTGGSSGGNPGGTTDAIKITSFSIVNGADTIASSNVNDTDVTVSLTTIDDSVMIGGINVSASPSGSTLVLTRLESLVTGKVTFSDKEFSLNNTITISDLIDGDGNISLKTMRKLFGPSVTFYGKLKSGYNTSDVSLTLTLSSSTTIPTDNEWADIEINYNLKLITADIKSGNTKLSTMGVHNFLLSTAGTLPTWVRATRSSDWKNPLTVQGREDIKGQIVQLIGGGTTWSDATLGQLSDKSIYFKDQAGNPWEISFVS